MLKSISRGYFGFIRPGNKLMRVEHELVMYQHTVSSNVQMGATSSQQGGVRAVKKLVF